MNVSHKLLFPLGLFVLMLAGCASSSQEQVSGAEGNSSNSYTVEVSKTPEVTSLFLNYAGPLPSPETVDKNLMEEMEKAIKENSSIDILGAAFLGDDELTSKQYSGKLIYLASQKKILTEEEFDKL
jgi:hypothetical protein